MDSTNSRDDVVPPGAGRAQRKTHPLGPLVWRERLLRPVLGRVTAVVLFAVCVSALAMAAWLEPDPAGFGTHRQLGYGACGFMVRTGFPCPTCGMTTSCSLTVRGRLGAAFRAQPMGPILVLGAVVGATACLAVVVSGKTWVINWYRISPLRVVWIVGVCYILAWGLTIAMGLIDGSLPARDF